MRRRLVWGQYRKLLQTTLIGAVFLYAAPRVISEHFRTSVIAGLVRVVQSRQYLNTIGCNRAMFTFTPKERTRQPCN